MTKKKAKVETEETVKAVPSVLLVTGKPDLDFLSWADSKDKPFDHGLKLLRKYGSNHKLATFCAKVGETDISRRKLLEALILINRRYQ